MRPAVSPCPNSCVEAATTGPIGRHRLDDRTAALASLAALLALRGSAGAYRDCVGRALAAGASVVMPLDNMFWGDRYAQIKDPFGHQWSIGGPIKGE